MPFPDPEALPADGGSSEEEMGLLSSSPAGARKRVQEDESDVASVQEKLQRACCFCIAGAICGALMFILGAKWEASHMKEPTSISPKQADSSLAPATSSAVPIVSPAGPSTTLTTVTLSTSIVHLEPLGSPQLGSSNPSYRFPYDPDSDAFHAKPLACLRQSTPWIKGFQYPSDAEDHFEELNRTMSAFVKGVRPLCGKITAGFCGPWIENYWIWSFSNKWKNRANGTRLRDIFGPYIPILFPFLDIFIPHFYRYPPGIIEALNRTMRPNVLYLAVSQNDDGLFGHNLQQYNKFKLADFPNLFVMSAGGYGHVALPLFKQTEAPAKAAPIMERSYAVGFMGSLNHGPAKVRQAMKAQAESWGSLRNRSVKIGQGAEDWRGMMANTSLNLSPRGFGRNSYRTLEILQMGLIPIYISAKGAWLFYRDLWVEEKIGFHTTADALLPLLDHAFSNIPKLLDMEKRIRAMRETHFLPEGIMDQISKFITERDGGGDLRCEVLPESVI